MREFILKTLSEVQNGYSLCGIVDRRARVYPLSSDTKVISALFEIVARQAIVTYANHMELQMIEQTKQNYYPDFTLTRRGKDNEKIAIDVKTTYRREGQERFSYTLGSYTSYIHPEAEKKNIVFPYSQYSQHWIVGFVYKRATAGRNASGLIYSFDTLENIPIPFNGVEVFMQEKWRIAGDRAGSGNTTNIGSIVGTISDFNAGNGVFISEEEFLEYWRGYKRTEQERRSSYSNIREFRAATGARKRE